MIETCLKKTKMKRHSIVCEMLKCNHLILCNDVSFFALGLVF
jgi:hypothetical protein